MRTQHEATDPSQRIAAARAELDALPEQEQAALFAADTNLLATLAARRRILDHQLDTAVADRAAAEQQALADEVTRVNTELLETVHRASEYDFAASVYRNLAAEWRSREAHLNSRMLRLLERTTAGGAR